jgi:hypothetical protein
MVDLYPAFIHLFFPEWGRRLRSAQLKIRTDLFFGPTMLPQGPTDVPLIRIPGCAQFIMFSTLQAIIARLLCRCYYLNGICIYHFILAFKWQIIPFCVVGLVDKVQTVVTIWFGHVGSSVTWCPHCCQRTQNWITNATHERLLYQFGGSPVAEAVRLTAIINKRILYDETLLPTCVLLMNDK